MQKLNDEFSIFKCLSTPKYIRIYEDDLLVVSVWQVINCDELIRSYLKRIIYLFIIKIINNVRISI